MKTEMLAPTGQLAWKHFCLVVLFISVTAAGTRAQTLTTLLSFDGTHGSSPTTTLVQGLDGAMYGTTPSEIFRITPGGQARIVYSPLATPNALVLANDGSFYGTTMDYAFVTCGLIGQVSCGSVFSLSPRGTLTSFFSFQPATEGAGPSTLVQASDGNFYGTTVYGGANANPCKPWVGCGTVFKITPAGQQTTLYNFCSQKNCADGSFPTGLVLGPDGAFYGTTYQSGETQAIGTVFKITPSGKLTTLHTFCSFPNCSDGFFPRGPLALGSDGNFYGTTESDGNIHSGVIFKITPTGTFTTLYTFCSQTGCSDGVEPNGGLIQANDGNFYGTTSGGGNNVTSCSFSVGCGTIFKITPAGALTTLYEFDFGDGLTPIAGLVQGTNGTFYGTTTAGGSIKITCNRALGCGTVFNFSTGLPPFVKLVSGSGKVGQTVGILGQGFTGTTDLFVNGTPANFAIISDTFIRLMIPSGATSGFVRVNTPSGTLTSDVALLVR